MSEGGFLERGVAIVKKAVEDEQRQAYDDALRNYQHAIEYFMTALKYERNERTKETVRRKIVEYLDRAEAIKQLLVQQQQQSGQDQAESKSASTGGTTATK